MAAATSGIWNHAAAQSTLQASPMDTTGSDGGTDSSGDSAVISANDFLSLLVTEMQNQDPTADTDPNEYIDQLVNVNSLEQLISINQTLSGALGTTTSGTGTTSGDSSTPQSAGTTPAAAAQATTASASSPAAGGSGAITARVQHLMGNLGAGNLGIPAANPAAQRVAHALTEKR